MNLVFFSKITKSPFTEKGKRANNVLDLIYTDVCGPMNISVNDGYVYFITFTDDIYRYGYVYLMKHMSESFEMFKWFQNKVKKQIKKSIKILRSDREGEYLSGEFLTYLEENEILS